MTDRYFVDQPIASKQAVRLEGAEAHHLIHVMRAQVDDQITLFDGSGVECSARVSQLDRSAVHARITDRREIDRELGFELNLGVALPKGDRQKWLVEKAVELGVARVVPLQADRSVAVVTASALDRLRRVVIEASKQCGRNRLMTIDPPLTTSAFFENEFPAARRLLIDPSGGPLVMRDDRDASVVIAIGPEGGFTDDECGLAAESNWEVVSLGPRILRTETAAIAVASYVALDSA